MWGAKGRYYREAPAGSRYTEERWHKFEWDKFKWWGRTQVEKSDPVFIKRPSSFQGAYYL